MSESYDSCLTSCCLARIYWRAVVEEIPDGTLDVLVVLIHTDAGIGEVTSQSYECKACFDAPRSAARRHGLSSILLGENPLDVERLWEKMYYETNRYGRAPIGTRSVSEGRCTKSRFPSLTL